MDTGTRTRLQHLTQKQWNGLSQIILWLENNPGQWMTMDSTRTWSELDRLIDKLYLVYNQRFYNLEDRGILNTMREDYLIHQNDKN